MRKNADIVEGVNVLQMGISVTWRGKRRNSSVPCLNCYKAADEYTQNIFMSVISILTDDGKYVTV